MAQDNNWEKPSALKTAFQWAGAACSVICAEAPQLGFNQAGNAYDYVKTWVGSKQKPKAPQMRPANGGGPL